MKKNLLLFIIVLTSLRLFADAGNAYRYKAILKLSDKREITGYFYFATYGKGFDKGKEDFKNYIFSNYHFPIQLYKTIKTINIGNKLTVDFALAGSSDSVNKNEIVSIDLISEIETEVGSRLIEVSQKEFEIIDQNFLSYDSFYNEKYAINCTFYLLSWTDENNLKELKEELFNNIENLMVKSNEMSVIQYIARKKVELVEKKILLFEYCGPP
jgi:hypothetical protein